MKLMYKYVRLLFFVMVLALALRFFKWKHAMNDATEGVWDSRHKRAADSGKHAMSPRHPTIFNSKLEIIPAKTGPVSPFAGHSATPNKKSSDVIPANSKRSGSVVDLSSAHAVRSAEAGEVGSSMPTHRLGKGQHVAAVPGKMLPNGVLDLVAAAGSRSDAESLEAHHDRVRHHMRKHISADEKGEIPIIAHNLDELEDASDEEAVSHERERDHKRDEISGHQEQRITSSLEATNDNEELKPRNHEHGKPAHKGTVVDALDSQEREAMKEMVHEEISVTREKIPRHHNPAQDAEQPEMAPRTHGSVHAAAEEPVKPHAHKHHEIHTHVDETADLSDDGLADQGPAEHGVDEEPVHLVVAEQLKPNAHRRVHVLNDAPNTQRHLPRGTDARHAVAVDTVHQSETEAKQPSEVDDPAAMVRQQQPAGDAHGHHMKVHEHNSQKGVLDRLNTAIETENERS